MREFAKLVMLRLLRGYKWAVSPMFPPACRYVPTCSEYAIEAVERYGAMRGGVMALLRLLRCHPFASGGYDPVMRQHLGSDETKTGSAFMNGSWTKALLPQGLKPECLLALDGAARSRALSMQDQMPHFSQRTREMGHPTHERVTDQEQLPTSPTQLHGTI
jgi:uncharacterized protein